MKEKSMQNDWHVLYSVYYLSIVCQCFNVFEKCSLISSIFLLVIFPEWCQHLRFNFRSNHTDGIRRHHQIDPKNSPVKWELIVPKWFAESGFDEWKMQMNNVQCTYIYKYGVIIQNDFFKIEQKKFVRKYVRQPTWCCINWCDRTQVSGNP